MLPLRITLHGAAGEVTGSLIEVTTPTARVVIDFGLFQGSFEQEDRNCVLPSVDFARVDAVLVTHAHIDHCGRLGLLPTLGFHGPIFASEPTAELLPFVMRGSASLQQLRVDEYRKGSASRTRVLEPAALRWESPKRTSEPKVLFLHRDVELVRKALIAIEWNRWREIAPGVSARFHHASHMLGAASIELECTIAGRAKQRILFSGDVGSEGNPLLAPHGVPDGPIDFVVMETTNGARAHEYTEKNVHGDDGVGALRAIVENARKHGEKLLFPSFAIGRSQLLVRCFAELHRSGDLGNMPVYVDSAMAARACGMSGRWPELLAPAAQRMRLHGDDPLDFDSLHLLMSRADGASADAARGPCAIIAGSGFCDAGPIMRHLRRGLGHKDTVIVFAGHVMHDSLAHALVHGATQVEINEEVIDVQARMKRIHGFSGHASPAELIRWLKRVPGTPRGVLLNHGSVAARAGMAEMIRTQCGLQCVCPAVAEPVEV
ncbi:MAG: MBL fold metallo-hydrolase [Planctomycetota bacterium]|nr:MBL fold metallo-hydrolase [Planctomycetota bacterium]